MELAMNKKSKLWDNMKKDKDLVECISCHKKVDAMKATRMMESKDLILCEDCIGCYTVAELWTMQDQHEAWKKIERQRKKLQKYALSKKDKDKK